MYKPLTSPTLENGDLIAVAYNHWFVLGIFLNYGPVGNVRYQNLSLGQNSEEKLRLWFSQKKLRVDYINADPNGRVLKITEDSLTDEQKEHLFKLRRVLFEFKKIK